MNRLIIIGNGFDLAHELKTKFNDFFTDYLAKSLNTYVENIITSGNSEFDDDLLNISSGNYFLEYGYRIQKGEFDIDNIFEKIDYLKKNKILDLKFQTLLLDNYFFMAKDLKWVDFEQEYFKVLCATKYSASRTHSKGISEVRVLNEKFEKIKDEFLYYLRLQQFDFHSKGQIGEYISCFLEALPCVDNKSGNRPNNLYFLNFNYTDTIEPYFEICQSEIPSELNYIHGNLNKKRGNPIVGFGDEFNSEYLKFENESNNDLFTHIKSYQYLQNNNFRNLISFIDSEVFSVSIFGHSCGLSDRTLLKQIFEHQNCKFLKIFYHENEDNKNDYTEKLYEISRHFSNKTIFRNKLISFEDSNPMPQLKK